MTSNMMLNNRNNTLVAASLISSSPDSNEISYTMRVFSVDESQLIPTQSYCVSSGLDLCVNVFPRM